ncbi:hypothetical protein INS49_006582 [Diaporthe citri]|uniref:uncharacterized protein n=1 Tax=Diaporthe citri TaxID=83186 RepID=UPI001C7FB2D0|nr:uncharacterized protein INS49_006582 [Diaporthe citri]KAG6364977.1 hypothetical protein INS49_006582 [Diaporthe citri]
MEAVTRLDWTNLSLKDIETVRDMKKNIRLHTTIPLGLAAGHRHPLAILPDKCMGPQLEEVPGDNVAIRELACEERMCNNVENHMGMGDAGENAFIESFCDFEELDSNGIALD